MAVSAQISAAALKCPVCSAGFRDTAICPRCGCDLQLLMKIAARAWALRRQARTHLRNGDLASALRCSAQARHLHRIATSAKP
jgi:hypothetical protein